LLLESTLSPGSPGERFRAAISESFPVQIVGAVTAYSALLAQRTGFKALYVSGGGVAASSCGLPDLGITTLDDVLIDVRRVCEASPLPVLVDVDTGWGSNFNIARTVKSMVRVGAAALHIEDQVQAKRCGHRPGKAIVSAGEMVDRIKAAVDARTDPSFVIMARTDAVAVEGTERAIERAVACVEAGADMIFPEAIGELDLYGRFVRATGVPVLANITEFGKTPLFTVSDLHSHGVRMVLYPLSAFRAMSEAALMVYETILATGTQAGAVDRMQTRAELYEVLEYGAYEAKLDELFARETGRTAQ
jgi:methylisocitrate lyase